MAEGSVIGQGSVVRGNVHGEGAIEIYGRVEGDVQVTGDVTIGENASVRGDVHGARITVGGTVQGELRGSEAVVLERSAQVQGDITAPRVGIEEGASARGALRTEEPGKTGGGRAAEPRRATRPAEPVRREPVEAPRAAPPPRPAARPAEPPAKKQPPAPVVPAFRGLSARKKKVRAR